jgi:putative transposase
MKTVEQEQDVRPERALPPGVLDVLGELAGAAKDGLLALSVGVGLGVLSEIMEAELDEVVGPKHAKNKERAAGSSRPRGRRSDLGWPAGRRQAPTCQERRW